MQATVLIENRLVKRTYLIQFCDYVTWVFVYQNTTDQLHINTYRRENTAMTVTSVDVTLNTGKVLGANSEVKFRQFSVIFQQFVEQLERCLVTELEQKKHRQC